MRSILLPFAALACLGSGPLLAACGGASNGTTSAEDGGTDAAGIVRREDAGGGNGTGGDSGAVVVEPQGTQVLSSPSAYLEGVTDDGFAVYQDTSTNALYATPIATPGASPKTITSTGTDYMAGLGVVGTTVLMLSGTNTSQVGKLTAWTSATGTKVLSSLSTLFAIDITDDGSTVAFYDNVVEMGGALVTGDLTVSKIDGTGKQVLAKGVMLEGGNCQLPSAEVLFLGTSNDLFALSCTPTPADGGAPAAGDAGAGDASVAGDAGDANDAGDADAGHASTGEAGEDGGNSAGPPETITMYSGASWAAQSVATDVAYGSTFGTDRANGKPGTQILFNDSEGLVTYAVGAQSPAPTLITSTPTATAAFSTDGTQVLYATLTGTLVETPTAPQATPTTLATGKYNYIVGESPDPKSQYALVATSETRDQMSGVVSSSDLYLAQTTVSNTPNPISTMATNALYGQGFTADSKFAVFDEGVSGGVGNLFVQATTGSNAPVQIGPNSWIDDEPTASIVIFNANCSSCTTMYVPGEADIQVVDLSKTTQPTTIVTQADYNFYLTKDKSTLVYSWHPSTSSGTGDAGASKAGIWTWPVP